MADDQKPPSRAEREAIERAWEAEFDRRKRAEGKRLDNPRIVEIDAAWKEVWDRRTRAFEERVRTKLGRVDVELAVKKHQVEVLRGINPTDLVETLRQYAERDDALQHARPRGPRAKEPDAIDLVVIREAGLEKSVKQIWKMLVAEGGKGNEIESNGKEVWISRPDGRRKRSISEVSIATIVSRLRPPKKTSDQN